VTGDSHFFQTDTVRAELRHEGQIALEGRRLGQRKAMRRLCERAVGDAAQIQLSIPDEEKFAADGRPRIVEGRCWSPLRERAKHGLGHGVRKIVKIDDQMAALNRKPRGVQM